MYDLIRKVLLFTAMILLTFVVMYFVTGYVLIHRELILEGQNDKENVRLPLSTTQTVSPDDVLRPPPESETPSWSMHPSAAAAAGQTMDRWPLWLGVTPKLSLGVRTCST